jgi:uncharacterized spore protein YtfJ
VLLLFVAYCLRVGLANINYFQRRWTSMESVESLVKTTLSEIEKVLSTKTVVGEPLTVEGTTLVPLISAGFAFGAAGGSGRGEASQKGEGYGGGTGGGAFVKPVAVVIVAKEGVKVEPILGSLAGAVEKLGETIPNLIEKWWERRKEEQE